MDIIGSFLLRLEQQPEKKLEQDKEPDGIENALSDLLQVRDKPVVSEFEENLMYGINVTVMLKGGRKRRKVCYLNQDSPSLICFIESDQDRIAVLDVKNMDLVDDNQMLQENIPGLSTLPYLCLRQKTESIVLVFTEEEKRDAMISNFRMMRLKLNFFEPYDQEFAFAKKEFVLLSDHNNTIDVFQLRGLARRIGYRNSSFTEEALRITRANSKSTTTRVTYAEFMECLRLMYCTPVMYQIFNQYVEDKLECFRNKPNPMCLLPVLTKEKFAKFLAMSQREQSDRIQGLTNSYCLFEPLEEQQYQNSTAISLYTFGRFLFSNENSLLDPQRQQIYQEMTHPLNHYYCYSSHNTYLTGNQLTSKSKVQRYIEDLERGLKCVEIDVHDSFGDIIVKHGYTPTASIRFEDVVKAIQHFSEQHPGHFPIIVSLQVHLGPKQREKMAEILLENFGRKIMLIEKGYKCFPSPQDLKGKIVIKTDCRLDPNLTLEQIEEQQEDQPEIPTAIQSLLQIGDPPQIVSPKKKDKKQREKELQNKQHQWVKKESHTMLTKMTGLYKGQFCEESSYCENVSMDWQKLIDRVRKDPVSVVSYTSRSWLRVYPHGTQVLSSNFNPIPMMEVGAQIIALNTQVRDIYYFLLHAHFRENCCGYLLKPEELRSGRGLVREQTVRLQLQVVASLNIRSLDSYDEFKYHVKLGFFGSELDDTSVNDMRKVKQVTEDVTDEDAFFQSSEPLYYIINQLYYSFIYFEITDFGKVAVPVRMMRQGYRALPLLNSNFEPIGASYLLIRVAFNTI